MEVSHYIVATAIIRKGTKYLILQRSLTEEKFPGRWTVPGGTLDTEDYASPAQNTDGIAYEAVEALIAREVLEETGLHITNIRYLTSLVYHKKKGPVLCLSFAADYASGTLVIGTESNAAAWVTSHEAKSYGMMDGIYEELLMADAAFAGKHVPTWSELRKEKR